MKKPNMRKSVQRELAESIHVTTDYDLKDFIAPQTTPVVSIYVPIKRTQRSRGEQDWDRIEFKDLAKEALRRLDESYDAKAVEGIVHRIHYILDHEDLPLWLGAGQGLAFLISNDEATVINMSFAPKGTVVAGDTYYLKPLMQNMQYLMNYKLLLLSTDFFSLLEGDYNGVHYVPLPSGVDDYFAETYPEFDGETTALDYYSLEDHMPPYHGFKSRNDVKQEEAEKFFRYVNKVMNDILVRDEETPVILVTDKDHDHRFRKICTFKSLEPESILKDPRTMTGQELRDAGVAVMEAKRAAEVKQLEERYGYLESKGSASADLTKIGMMLAERMVDTLFLEAGKGIPGGFDAQTGTVTFDGSTDPVDIDKLDPASPDIANAFALAAVMQDSTIEVLEPHAMPVNSGVAAIFRV